MPFLFLVKEQAIFQRNLTQLIKKHPDFPQVKCKPIYFVLKCIVDFNFFTYSL